VKREIALITGAGTRVGAEIALSLGRLGYGLVLHYNQSKPTLKESSLVHHVKADLSKGNGEKKIITYLNKKKIHVDIAIFNAANFLNGSVALTTPSVWEQSLNVNLQANFFLSQFLINQKIKHLIFIGDQRAENPYAGKAAYLISKAGIHTLIKILAKELPKTIRVHGIAPGIVLFPKSYSPELREKILKTAGLKKEAGTQQVVKTVLKLIKNKNIKNGKIIKVG
jgi:pteridine reductase